MTPPRDFFLANSICRGLTVPLLCIFNPDFSLPEQSLLRTLSVLWQKETRQNTILWLIKVHLKRDRLLKVPSHWLKRHTTIPVFSRAERKLEWHAAVQSPRENCRDGQDAALLGAGSPGSDGPCSLAVWPGAIYLSFLSFRLLICDLGVMKVSILWGLWWEINGSMQIKHFK